MCLCQHVPVCLVSCILCHLLLLYVSMPVCLVLSVLLCLSVPLYLSLSPSVLVCLCADLEKLVVELQVYDKHKQTKVV